MRRILNRHQRPVTVNRYSPRQLGKLLRSYSRTLKQQAGDGEKKKAIPRRLLAILMT